MRRIESCLNISEMLTSYYVLCIRMVSGGAAEARLGAESVLKALGRQQRTETPPDAVYDFSLAAADCNLKLLAHRLLGIRSCHDEAQQQLHQRR